ncbi:MAG: PhoH family protein [Acidimicrobiia bacterium]|nr:PhoH family protein [bacterium]MXW59218.1 PhoH family protein [Acidimicrobiia bacterium]MDE0613050.1 PhoH family protein [bacterium]MXZ79702.1 PhoH family protein [Acidimicrobiia bacterium]MXZ85307.1 PhoH family protein [Acidimicrobiia bacterium]
MTTAAPVTIDIARNGLMAALLGERDQHLRQIEQSFPDADIFVRGNRITVSGQSADRVAGLFDEMILLVQGGHQLDSRTLGRAIKMVEADESPSGVMDTDVLRSARGRVIRPQSAGQRSYVDAMRSNIITFSIGPAGTGKSWLAVATAVRELKAHTVERIILTRPAVEAGERLGFLPGDMIAKVDPYLRPLYDALYDMLDTEEVQSLIDRGVIEIAPLAYMRGRTLNDSFIILDEAQNTTPEQMKMFLTRIGFGSRAVVTGDVTQVDVEGGRSGLVSLEKILAGIDGLSFVHLSSRDVVRHPIVADIVNAYERAQQ